MKTSEMFAMLKKNPKLRFKRAKWGPYNSIGIKDDALQMITPTGEEWTYLGSDSATDRFVEACLQIGVGGDWELIQEPVTWQEALQAWAEGKTVRCKVCNSEFIYLYDIDEPELLDTNGDAILPEEITRGTWYIEA